MHLEELNNRLATQNYTVSSCDPAWPLLLQSWLCSSSPDLADLNAASFVLGDGVHAI